MNADQLDVMIKAFCSRRPLRSFLIEFTSGTSLVITHPEAVRREGRVYVARPPDGSYVMFASESVTRLLDAPPTKS